MNKHKAMPNIRFKGFEDEWKEKKFSTLVNRKSHITSDSSLLSVEYENISPDNHEIHKNFNNKKGIFFQKGDILFGKLRPYLKKYVLAFYEGKAVGDFWVLSPKKDIYSRFAFYLIQTHKFYVVSNLSSGTKMPRSDWNLVSNSFFYVCNIEEQQKIGDFFSKLNKLLDLQQQKIDKLELLKKALLQKLFPKHDAKIPELRFKGYKENWNEKKLNSITKRLDNYRKPITANKRLSGQTPYYGANGIQDYVKGYTHEGEFVLIAEDGANDIRNYPVRFVKGYIWVNNHAHVLQAKVGISNNLFLSYSLKNKNLLPYLVGSGRMKLNADVLMNLLLKIPDLNEQQKIGSILSKIDQLIESENRKLQNFQQVKKCLLQNMFVE